VRVSKGNRFDLIGSCLQLIKPLLMLCAPFFQRRDAICERTQGVENQARSDEKSKGFDEKSSHGF